MNTDKSISCYIIGDDNLVIQCGEILLSKKNNILGVISLTPSIQHWAVQHQIPHFSTLSEFKNIGLKKPCDYIFSIVNYQILPEWVLSLPNYFSINYHDSLLPKYAGVHATSWALMNEEKIHGITWHIMDKTIDTGDILVQKNIYISPKDTTLSLNLKCFQAAIETFNLLVDELVTKTYYRKPQKLAIRSYFSNNKKPTGNGWINWIDSAENIEKRFRALHFGDYPNRLAKLKFLIGDCCYIISQLKLLKITSSSITGTIIGLSEKTLQISTRTKDIIINELKDINGGICSITEIIKRHSLKIGDILNSPTTHSQQQYLSYSEDLARYESFWCKELEKVKTTSLPFLLNKTIQYNTDNVSHFTFNLTDDIKRKIRSSFQENSQETILLTIWIVYLYRLNYLQEQVSIAISCPGRDYLLPALITSFLPFNIQIKNNLCFEQTLKKIEEYLEIIKGKKSYLSDIKTRFSELTDKSHELFISVIFTKKFLDNSQKKHPITLLIEQDCIHFYIRKEYKNKNFNHIIRQIPLHLEKLLHCSLSQKHLAIQDLNFLTEEEINKIIGWNQTKSVYPYKKTVIELFEEQVSKKSDKIAIIFNEIKLTYFTLNKHANQIAFYLKQEGIEAGESIPLCIEQSPEMIIAILAILKIGAVYVPIDPEYPKERIKFILHDIKTEKILTSSKTLKHLSDKLSSNKKIITIDPSFYLLFPEVNVSNKKSTSDDPLYIMYTSGSTGKPKGVVISNKNVIKLVKNINYVEINENDCIAQASNIAFDASTFEIWGALLNGAKIALISKEEVLSPDLLFNSIISHNVSILWLTAGLFNQHFKQDSKALQAISKLLIGGEALNYEIVKNYISSSKNKSQILINGYGPTECTTFSLCYKIDKSIVNYTSIPIGQPIDNTTCYVLDKHLQLVSAGVTGELYIGGDGIGLGYFNQPTLTQDKFIADPFSKNKKDKLYRTGDLVRRLPNGLIEYLSRLDDQVKVRGFRIEFGELEKVFLQYRFIEQVAFAINQVEEHTHQQLMAFIVFKTNHTDTPDIKDLIQFLKIKLPNYMIPSLFYELKKLPLTFNGKIDRNALVKLSYINEPLNTQKFAAPENMMQSKLIQIWQKIFKKDHIGIDDDFFAIGGDSIVAMQLISEANHQKLYLSIKQIFTYPTIHQLSSHVISKKLEFKNNELAGNVSLTPIQEWFFTQPLNKKQAFSHACLISLTKQVEIKQLNTAFKTITSNYDAFFLRYKNKADQWQQYYANSSEASFKDTELLIENTSAKSQKKDYFQQLVSRIHNNFDLTKGPLIRAVLISSKEELEPKLLIVAHHLIIDGYSWRLLLKDLERLLAEPDLIDVHQALSPTFQNWSLSLKEHKKTLNQEAYIKYQHNLSRNDFVLPLDHNLGPNIESSVERIDYTFSRKETDLLIEKSHKLYGIKFHELLIGAFIYTLSGWTKSKNVLVNLEGHGREESIANINLSNAIGWFTNLYPASFFLEYPLQVEDAIVILSHQLKETEKEALNYNIFHSPSKNDRQPTISFNYWGKFDHIFSKDSSLKFQWLKFFSSSQNLRPHLLDVETSIINGQLKITWAYSKNFHRVETIKKVSAFYCANLRILAKNEGIIIKQTSYELNHQFFRLTPLQKGLLFHSVAMPASEAYAVQLICPLSYKINHIFLREAFEKLVDNYSILRTSYHWETIAEPIQIIQEKIDIIWHEYNWQNLEPKPFSERLEEFLKADREANFLLSQSPLFRISVIKSKNFFQFVFHFHHILLDGWSVFLLLNKLGEIYSLLKNKKSLRLLPQNNYHYYINYMNNLNLPSEEAFWRSYLKGFSSPTGLSFFMLPSNHIKEGIDYKSNNLVLSTTLSERLSQFCRLHKITISTLFQSIWGLLLSRYERNKDIVFGVTVTVRPPEIFDIGETIGLMINTVPLRLEINEEMIALDFFKELQDNFLYLMNHTKTPLTQIQAWANTSTSRDIFNTIIAVENYPTKKIAGLGIHPNQVRIIDPTHYPLTLSIIPGKRITIKLNYNNNRIDSDSIEFAKTHFDHLLKEILKSSHLPLKKISALSQVEYRRIKTKQPHLKDNKLTIHSIFEEQVRKNPKNIALIYERNFLTYQQVNTQANQLAHYLIQQGATAGSIIGICCEKEFSLIVGILAILKTGSAYVPIEPRSPFERINLIIEDCEAKILITNSEFIKENKTFLKTNLIYIDDHLESIAAQAQSNPMVHCETQQLAYIIYTSGSTGTPKGVLIEHRNVVRLFIATEKLFQFNSNDAWSLFHSYAFDFSVWEIWGALFYGAKLHIVSQQLTQDLNHFYELLVKKQISILNITPNVFYKIITIHQRKKANLSLRYVILGGEALSFKALLPWFDMPSNQSINLINMYGITESTVHTTYYKVRKDDAFQESSVIGKPFEDRQVYILDMHLNPVPVKVAGEIYIGGGGIARGYLNQKNLTSERFIQNPFTNGKNNRLYKTGDLARWLPNGNLEYLGRIDEQVKIRGFRIELGEIQHHLESHPDIQQAIVIAHQHSSSGNKLIAYLVKKTLANVDDKILASFLSKVLPYYMLPSHYIFLAEMPVTNNGKLNRSALPEPDINFGVENNFLPPKTDLEKQLTKIFSKVLHIPASRISRNHNFFDIGGHSLSSLEVLSQLYTQNQLDLPLHIFLENPSVQSLANIMESSTPEKLAFDAATGKGKNSKLPNFLIPLKPQGTKSPLFLIHPIGGTVFWYIHLVRYLSPAQPLYGIQDPGLELNNPKTYNTIAEMAHAYIEAIRIIQPQGPFFIGGASAGASISMEVASQLELQGETIAFLGLFDGWAPFPDILRHQEYFEANMRRQYNYMRKEFAAKGIYQADTLLALQWQRSQMIANYVPPHINSKITLFKATETVITFQSIDAPLNHWESYSTQPIELHLVPGDHETMFHEPHIAVLGSVLNQCIVNK